MAKGITVRGFRKGAKKSGTPISLTVLVAASGVLHIEVDDQNGLAMTVDPTTIAGGSMTSDNVGAVVTQPNPSDFLNFNVTVDPTLGSSGTVVNISDVLSFTTTPPGSLSDTEQLLCDLAPPISVPTTIKIVIG